MGALANNITNCEFMTGSVEEHLPNLWRRVTFSEAICVIDPPRAGIGSKAIQSIRKYASVTKVIYVASDPQSAVKNFLDFVRPPSNIFKGDPFVPVKAAPVDLFPHTSNFCIVFLFMRVKMADLISPENVNVESYLRGAGEKQNSRGASRGLTNNTNPYRNSNTFPEHSVNAGPAPDLTWKKVQASSNNTIQSNQQSRESLSSELSEEQIDWLDQMVQLYGSAFQRDQWIESFKAQNAEASANYLAGIEQSQTYPTAQESLKKTEQNNPANSAAKNGQGNFSGNTAVGAPNNWADYSKQYAQYNQYWSQQQAQQQAQQLSNKPQFPQPPQPPPAGSDSESWKAYCQLMARYWSHWSSQADQSSACRQTQGKNTANLMCNQLVQPPLPTTNPPPLPKGPAP